VLDVDDGAAELLLRADDLQGRLDPVAQVRNPGQPELGEPGLAGQQPERDPGQRLTATVGRGAPGPSSNRRSSSTRTGIRSGINGRRSISQDSQPRDAKKLKIMTGDHRNTTRPTAKRKRPAHVPCRQQSPHYN
jgi:hypothetical protein